MKVMACSLFALVSLIAASTEVNAQDDPQVPKIAYKVMDSIIACTENALEVAQERKPQAVPTLQQQIASFQKTRADLPLTIHGDPKIHSRGEGAVSLAEKFNGSIRANALNNEMNIIQGIQNLGGDPSKCIIAMNSIR